MKTIAEKRKIFGMSQEKLANRIGVSRSAIAMWETGGSSPGTEELKMLSNVLQVSVDALLENDIAPGVQTGVRVPVLGRIPAGIPIEAIEDICDYEEIPAEWMAGAKEYFALKIQGDSMSPKYLENDIVIFQKIPDCDSGAECAVIVNGNDATFKKVTKQVGGVVLHPINTTDFEPVFYSNEEVERLPVTVIGVAREIRRKP